jgi:hypothetical protein
VLVIAPLNLRIGGKVVLKETLLPIVDRNCTPPNATSRSSDTFSLNNLIPFSYRSFLPCIDWMLLCYSSEKRVSWFLLVWRLHAANLSSLDRHFFHSQFATATAAATNSDESQTRRQQSICRVVILLCPTCSLDLTASLFVL